MAAEEFGAWVSKVVGERLAFGTVILYTIEHRAFRVERLSRKDGVLCFNQQVARMAIPAL
jgi:hypothetical protein